MKQDKIFMYVFLAGFILSFFGHAILTTNNTGTLMLLTIVFLLLGVGFKLMVSLNRHHQQVKVMINKLETTINEDLKNNLYEDEGAEKYG